MQLRMAAVFAFVGSLAANVMILTFFGIPFAMGWHLGVGWLCVAWAALGTGTLTNRTVSAMLVWAAGLAPLIPVVLFEFEYDSPSQNWLLLALITLPLYVVFWFYRRICGSYVNATLHSLNREEHLRTNQTSLFNLFSTTTLCAILLAAAVPLVTAILGPDHIEYLWALLSIPGMFLLPLLTKVGHRSKKNRFGSPIGYLVSLSAMGTVGVFAGMLVSVDSSNALFLALIALLVFFTVGATVTLGLTLLHDWGYKITSGRLGRSLKDSET